MLMCDECGGWSEHTADCKWEERVRLYRELHAQHCTIPDCPASKPPDPPTDERPACLPSIGLFQLSEPSWPAYPPPASWDPVANATAGLRYAHRVFRSWAPWSAGDAYRQALREANPAREDTQ